LKKLREDPSNPGLRTHVVYSSYGRTYSSRVSEDIRILWRFEDGNIILLLTIGVILVVVKYINKWYNTNVLCQYGDVRLSTGVCV